MLPELLLKFASFKGWNSTEHLQTMKKKSTGPIIWNSRIKSRNNLTTPPKNLKAFKRIQEAPYVSYFLRITTEQKIKPSNISLT